MAGLWWRICQLEAELIKPRRLKQKQQKSSISCRPSQTYNDIPKYSARTRRPCSSQLTSQLHAQHGGYRQQNDQAGNHKRQYMVSIACSAASSSGWDSVYSDATLPPPVCSPFCYLGALRQPKACPATSNGTLLTDIIQDTRRCLQQSSRPRRKSCLSPSRKQDSGWRHPSFVTENLLTHPNYISALYTYSGCNSSHSFWTRPFLWTSRFPRGMHRDKYTFPDVIHKKTSGSDLVSFPSIGTAMRPSLVLEQTPL